MANKIYRWQMASIYSYRRLCIFAQDVLCGNNADEIRQVTGPNCNHELFFFDFHPIETNF
jgi:hypothetical protein